MTELKNSIEIQRASLSNMLIDPMRRIAAEISNVLGDIDKVNTSLMMGLATLPYVKYLYAMDKNGVQISKTATRQGLSDRDDHRDRSNRPYMQSKPGQKDMYLSGSYISLQSKRPSVSAVQPLLSNTDDIIGFIGADVDLRDLPLTREVYTEPTDWQQLKGDPAIRGHLFNQCRIQSLLDTHIDDVLPVIEELMTESCVYHGKIHFSSSRATIWHIDDPYRYRILNYEALVDPDICFVYPHRPYPKDAKVPQNKIRDILETFKYLRFADENIYLRAGSVNIFNGIVGLNFSCDGSHYIPFEEFLAKDSTFWG